MLVPKDYLIPELIKLYLNYDPISGWLTWIRKPSNKVIIGNRAGTQVNGRDNRIIHLFGKVYSKGAGAFAACMMLYCDMF